jgi:hypothetical protein
VLELVHIVGRRRAKMVVGRDGPVVHCIVLTGIFGNTLRKVFQGKDAIAGKGVNNSSRLNSPLGDSP